MYGAGAALVCLGAYGVYRFLKKEKGTGAETEPKKENADESRTAETLSAGAAEATESGTDHSADSEVTRPVSDSEAEDLSSLTPEPEPVQSVTPEQAFFDAVYGKCKPVTADQQWNSSTTAVHSTKYRTSEPRGTMLHGQPVVIFPLAPGLNLTLTGNVIHYLDDKKREHVEFKMDDISRHMEASPGNQAKAYVFEKGMELLAVRENKIHPDYAYPDNFDTERGMGTNYQIKNAAPMEKSIAFFEKLFAGATPTTAYPYTRSDMAYISTIVNSEPVDVVTAFANLEGDRFVHFADPMREGKNMVLVHRSNGNYVQLFRANGVSMEMANGFKGWKKPVAEMFNISADTHMPLALFISADIAREVLVTTDEPEQPAAAE